MKTRFVPAFLFAALLSAPAPVAASEPDACAMIAMLAEATMRNRQAGVSLSDQLGISDHPDIRPIVRDLALAAWDEPRYTSPAVVARITGEFRDRWHARCLRSE